MQGTFLAGFGLTKAALPTAVTFSPRKLRGAQLHGAFSAKSIDTLIDGLFSGRVASSPFPVGAWHASPSLAYHHIAAHLCEACWPPPTMMLSLVLKSSGQL